MTPDEQQHDEQPTRETDVTAKGETTSLPDSANDTSPTSGNSPSPQGRVGTTLGKYKITGVLGQGGMGVVFRAYDPAIDREVAIKLLPEQLADNETVLNRFRAEVRSAGRLSHANVAAIYDVGEEGRAHYIVMELVGGGSVSDELQRHGALPVLDATRIAIDACQGLAAAHAAGLIHRDVKPANLLRAADGAVKLTDFGIAKVSSLDSTDSPHLTRTGTVVGTPHFMSPEQCQAEPVDARSDIYSLGATYYCALTGRQPYQDCDSVMQVLFAHCKKSIPDPRETNSEVPVACSEIIARAMAKDPSDRYQTAEAMLADLQAVASTLSGETRIELPSQSGTAHPAVSSTESGPTRRRFVAVGAGVAIACLAAVVAGSWMGRDPASGSSAIAAAQGDPIDVGVLQSLSGAMSVSGASVTNATLLAIDEINEQGGLLGRPVNPIVADGRSDSDVFQREAERLINDDQVCVVFGCWTSASRKSVKPIFEQHDHLLVYPVWYEGMETSPNIVYLGAAPNQQIIPAVTWARENLGKKRFFLVGSDYVFPRAAAEIIKSQLQETDASIVDERFHPVGSSDFQSTVQAIQAAKPDMVLNLLAGDANTAFFRALREAGVSTGQTPCLSFNVSEQELRTLNAADVVGDYAAMTYFQSLDTEASRNLVERFSKKYPQRVVSDPMEAAYIGVHLWAQAVREAGSVEPKAVRRAMLNQRLTAPEGEVRIDPDTQHCFKTPRVGQIQADGQFRIVWTAPAPIAPEPYPPGRTAEDWKAFLHDLYSGWGNQWAAPRSH